MNIKYETSLAGWEGEGGGPGAPSGIIGAHGNASGLPTLPFGYVAQPAGVFLRLAMVLAGIACIGCENAERPARATPAPQVAEKPPAAQQPDMSAFATRMPAGWRSLRWGMSETQVSVIMKREKWAHGSAPWKRGQGLDGLTVFAPDGRFFIVEREARFQCWASCGLEGASCVQAWFLDGKLIEVVAQAPPDIERSAFERRAGESYGAEPRRMRAVLIRPRGDRLADAASASYNAAPERELLFWRGPETTAVLYESPKDSRAQVAVWSSEAMPLIWAALLEKEAGEKAKADANRKRLEDATRF